MSETNLHVYSYAAGWSHIYILCRQKDHLTQIMSASGYRDKVPARIHEENVAKLASLMQEVLSFEQASQHLERDIAAEQEAHWFLNFASNFDCYTHLYDSVFFHP